MKHFFKVGLLFLALLSSATLCAQQSWTLAECIQYAKENNLSIKQQALNISQVQNQLEQSKWALAPSLSASSGYNLSWGRSVNQQDLTIIENQLSQSGSFSLSASVNLFDGLQNTNTIKQNQTQLEISEQEVEKLKNDLSVEIARNFLQVILAKEMLEATHLSFQSVSEQVERTHKLVDAGNLAHSNLLELQAQLAAEQVQVVNAENNLRTATLSLRQILDLPLDADFQITHPQVSIEEKSFSGADVDRLYTQSQNLPQIIMANHTVQLREHQLAIAKGRRYPSLSLSAGIGTNYNPDLAESFFHQLDNRRSPYVGLSLRIPIFSNMSIKTSISNARLTVQMSQIEMRNRQQMLYKEIQQANNDAISCFQRYQATEQNVKAIQESFRYVQQRFDLGMLNGTDYTVAKNNLFRAQSDNLQAKYQYVFQLKILDFYKGIPITL
jgi:Outer membrane protein